jgi:hypothetical protein
MRQRVLSLAVLLGFIAAGQTGAETGDASQTAVSGGSTALEGFGPLPHRSQATPGEDHGLSLR